MKKIVITTSVFFLLSALLIFGGGTQEEEAAEEIEKPTPVETKVMEELKTVRIAYFAPLSLQIPLLASEMGFDEEFGIKLELMHIARASDALQTLLTGDLDITFGAFLTAETAKLKGANVKGIMVAYYGGYKSALVTLKKTGITKVEDIAGKTVAVPGLGAPPELFVRMAAKLSGISPDSFELVQQRLDMIPAALATDQVDAGMLFEPLLTGFMKKQEGVVILTRGENIPVVNYVPMAYLVNEKFIRENNELIYKIFLSLAKAQWFIRTKGPDSDEVLSVVAKAADMPAAVFKPSAKKNIWDPRIKPIHVANVKEEMKFFVDIGKLDSMVPVSEIWDNSFFERALKEYPELFADLDNYIKELQEDGFAGDEDFKTGLKE